MAVWDDFLVVLPETGPRSLWNGLGSALGGGPRSHGGPRSRQSDPANSPGLSRKRPKT